MAARRGDGRKKPPKGGRRGEGSGGGKGRRSPPADRRAADATEASPRSQRDGSTQPGTRPRLAHGRGGRGRGSGGGRRGGGATRRGPEWVVGLHAVRALLAATPSRIRTLHVWSAQAHDVGAEAAAAGVTVRREQPEEFSGDAHLAQGVAARVAPFAYVSLTDLLQDGAQPRALLLALDSITDTRNLGAILRSAGFFGVKAVIIPRDRAAAVTAVTERIARGGAAIVPVAQVTNLARALDAVSRAGWRVVGTALDDVDGELWDEDLTAPTCLVLGAEDTGLRRLVRQRCHRLVSLRGDPRVQSLNVASFATLAMAEARRQQRSVVSAVEEES